MVETGQVDLRLAEPWTTTESSYDLIGPYVEPPKPVLTITEERRERGWVYAWSKCGGPNTSLHDNVITYSSIAPEPGAYARGIAVVHPDGPFVCRESDWPRVQELVAKVNATA